MKTCGIVVFISSILFFLSTVSCANRPSVPSVSGTRPEFSKPEHPVPAPSPGLMDQITLKVQKNFKTIDNYFIPGETSEIIVKARLREGDEDYEITYDLQRRFQRFCF